MSDSLRSRLAAGSDLAAGSRILAARFGRSPLADAPPSIRASYTPAQRLDIANYCGPDDARTVPMDTGRTYGPAPLGANVPGTPRNV